MPQEIGHRTLDHLLAQPGAEVDYFSRKYKCWAPTHITHVDTDKGLITLHARTSPLKTQEFMSSVRERSRPGKVQLEWIRRVMDGKVEKEADRLFADHSDIVVEFEDQESGEVVSLDALTLPAILRLGSLMDERLGVSGNAYELKRRATQEMRRRNVELPAGWRQKLASTGAVYYAKLDGTASQWDWPGEGKSLLVLPQSTFNEVFWEALQNVYQKYALALSPKLAQGESEVDPRDYSIGKALGEGSFGFVHVAEHLPTGQRRAIKTIKRSRTKGVQDEAQNEIMRMRQLDHPNIVKLYAHWMEENNWKIVMDFCSGGDLSERVKLHRREAQPVDEDIIKDIMKQILRAVSHMHAHGIMHLDLKPGNVTLLPDRGTLPPAAEPDRMLARSGQELLTNFARTPHIMIIDFGLSKLFQPWDKYGARCGTPATMAPEVWSDILTPAADVFSCGCILFHMLTFKYPFEAPNMTEQAIDYWQRQQPKGVPFPPNNVHSDLSRQFSKSMMALHRLDRPVASKCLEHEYLNPPRSQHDLSDSERSFRVFDKAKVQVDSKVTQRMRKLAEKDVLYRSIALQLASDWSANRLGSIKRAFEKFDETNSGRLAIAQVQKVLISLGFDHACAREAAEAMDFKRNGFVEWTEFVASCLHLGSGLMDKDLERMFKQVDQDGDGLVGKKDLEKLLTSDFLRENGAAAGVAERLMNGKEVVDFRSFRNHFVTANPEDLEAWDAL